MAKELMVNGEKCSGCRTCEMVCSAQHEKVINPYQSRIKVIKWEFEGEGCPTVCAQCEDAPCRTICPVRAISRDEELGRVMVDHETCIGCRMCVAACPFGVIHFDGISRRVLKCDLCDGDPLCVKFCSYEALEYIEVSEIGTDKRRASARQLLEFMRRPGAAAGDT
jgi:Fe-S-cluster-containing hydrogenase component 2